MFDEPKDIAAGILIVVVLGVAWGLWHTYHTTQEDNKALTTQVTVQQHQIQDDAKTIVTQEKSGEINNQVVSQHAQTAQGVTQKFDVIDAHQKAQENAIHNHPPVAPAPVAQPTASAATSGASAPVAAAALPAGVSAEDAAVSVVRINALWDGYCVAAPTAAQCQGAH